MFFCAIKYFAVSEVVDYFPTGLLRGRALVTRTRDGAKIRVSPYVYLCTLCFVLLNMLLRNFGLPRRNQPTLSPHGREIACLHTTNVLTDPNRLRFSIAIAHYTYKQAYRGEWVLFASMRTADGCMSWAKVAGQREVGARSANQSIISSTSQSINQPIHGME